jgi:hypothetical protein
MQRSSTCRRRPDGNGERANMMALATPSVRFWAMEVRGPTQTHPYQVSRAKRCADQRFPRSLASVRGEGMRS